jgi:pteridine reductase
VDLQGRTALVTGGAVRVGRAISLALAGAGARVIVHFHSSARQADELVDRIRGAGGEASAIGADLSSRESVETLVARAEEAGPVDILVNNASIFPPQRFEEVSGDLWEETIAVNLRAPFFLTQGIGMAMKERGSGVVINLADLAGIQTWSGYAAHSISKAGVVHLTRIAARALAPEVRVVAIAPGTVLPPIDLTAQEIDRLAARAPLKRIGSPQDVADTVLFLVSADFITGEMIVVDGGRNLG